MDDLKLASNLAPFSRLSDRFVSEGYGEGHEFSRQLELLAGTEGISGVALGWPSQFQDAAALRVLLAEVGLELATVDADIYTEARFKHGSLSNPDPALRRAAVDRVKAAIEASRAAGAPDLNLWLGHDGFDYPFQGHYADAWQWIEEGLAQVAAHDPSFPISLEYKPKEPRANQYVANLGKALWLVAKLDQPHLGLTLDVGHSLAALENAAECAVLALRAGRLQQVHLNDNYRDWDHDLSPAAIHLWEFVEFFYWVRKLGYRGWFSLDIFPYREDGVQIVRQAVGPAAGDQRQAAWLLRQPPADLVQRLALLWHSCQLA